MTAIYGGSTKFLFQYFSNIIVANLTFSACTVQRYSSTKHPSATLVFLMGYYLQLLSIKILMSVDETFIIENTCGDLVLSNVEVSHANTAGKQYGKREMQLPIDAAMPVILPTSLLLTQLS